MKIEAVSEKGFIDMPKLLSPFVRKEINGQYVCVPKITEEFKWVFTKECMATEKLDGTNVSIVVRGGKIIAVYNRLNPIDLFAKGNKRFAEGILEAVERGYIDLKKLNGQYFGELIGPQVNGNPYGLEKHLWMSFEQIKEHLGFKFWGEFVEELNGLTDEEVYKKVSEVFKGLWSLYKRKRGVKGEVNEYTKFGGLAAEGIVFYRRGAEIKLAKVENRITTLELCKLRRDMFDWFKGEGHAQ
ncbi:MAG: hypothetical protein HY362_03885 [Candidatus Aenigmarchaeota archaeon]|nr:hypothetical protein [Candidatus Aenigmarchaeota archaeon]